MDLTTPIRIENDEKFGATLFDSEDKPIIGQDGYVNYLLLEELVSLFNRKYK